MRRALAVLAVLRAGLALAAIPLAPLLYRDHPAILVLLRPTKEVFLFAGFSAQRGDVSLVTVIVAAMPILLGGVWIFFALGHEHGTDRDLPGLLGRLLPSKRVKPLRKSVERNDAKVLFLGRLAAMPSSLLAAAAGASGVDIRRFLVIDTARRADVAGADARARLGARRRLRVGRTVAHRSGRRRHRRGGGHHRSGAVSLMASTTWSARRRFSTTSSAGPSNDSPSATRRSGPLELRTRRDDTRRSL